MPLVKGPKARTKVGIAKNIRAESVTKPHKQAVAIALSVADRSKKTPRRKK